MARKVLSCHEGEKKSAGCRVLIIPSHQGCDPRMSTQKMHHFLNPGRTAGNLGFGGEGALTLFIRHSPSAYPYRVLITHTTLLALQILPGPNLPLSQFSVHQMPGRQVGRGVLGAGVLCRPPGEANPKAKVFSAASAQGPDAVEALGTQVKGAEKQFLDQQPGGACPGALGKHPFSPPASPVPAHCRAAGVALTPPLRPLVRLLLRPAVQAAGRPGPAWSGARGQTWWPCRLGRPVGRMGEGRKPQPSSWSSRLKPFRSPKKPVSKEAELFARLCSGIWGENCQTVKIIRRIPPVVTSMAPDSWGPGIKLHFNTISFLCNSTYVM